MGSQVEVTGVGSGRWEVVRKMAALFREKKTKRRRSERMVGG
jgi:hypothetical protein